MSLKKLVLKHLLPRLLQRQFAFKTSWLTSPRVGPHISLFNHFCCWGNILSKSGSPQGCFLSPLLLHCIPGKGISPHRGPRFRDWHDGAVQITELRNCFYFIFSSHWAHSLICWCHVPTKIITLSDNCIFVISRWWLAGGTQASCWAWREGWIEYGGGRDRSRIWIGEWWGLLKFYFLCQTTSSSFITSVTKFLHLFSWPTSTRSVVDRGLIINTEVI